MPATKLTAAAVAKLTGAATRREIADANAPGLHLVIQPSGAKTWAMRFRKPDGKHGKLTLGPVDISTKELKGEPVIGQPLTLAAARHLAAAIQRDRAMGLDVIEQHKVKVARQRDAVIDRKANSFGAAVREFFADYKTKRGSRPRRWRDDAAILGLRFPVGSDPAKIEPEIIKGGLADTWATKPVAEIDADAVHATVDRARKRGGDNRARKTFAALSVLFTWLVRQRRVASNPCTGVWRPQAPASRERILDDGEIVTFWKACDKVGQPFGPLFKLLLLTGCRLREAANMRRDELGADGTWTVPSRRTKNHRPLALPLSLLARQIIDNMPVIGDADFVFTTTGHSPVSGFSVAKRTLDAAMIEIAGRAVPGWRAHDLRRTTATGLAKLGISLPAIEKVLNHVSGSFAGVAGVYQRHEFEDEKREALQRWAGHIIGLVEGHHGKVVRLRAAP